MTKEQRQKHITNISEVVLNEDNLISTEIASPPFEVPGATAAGWREYVSGPSMTISITITKKNWSLIDEIKKQLS